MNIKKYETFVKVVELGSLTRAAEALHCTQSAVSHILSDLETEFGFSLLQRSRSGARLTENGAQVLPAIRGILNYFYQRGGELAAGHPQGVRRTAPQYRL